MKWKSKNSSQFPAHSRNKCKGKEWKSNVVHIIMNNEPHLLGIQLVIFYAKIFEEKNFFLEVPNFLWGKSVKKSANKDFKAKLHFFHSDVLIEKQESFFHHVENMQSKQNTLLVNLYS